MKIVGYIAFLMVLLPWTALHARAGINRRIHHTTEGFAYLKTGGTHVLAFHGLADFA